MRVTVSDHVIHNLKNPLDLSKLSQTMKSEFFAWDAGQALWMKCYRTSGIDTQDIFLQYPGKEMSTVMTERYRTLRARAAGRTAFLFPSPVLTTMGVTTKSAALSSNPSGQWRGPARWGRLI